MHIKTNTFFESKWVLKTLVILLQFLSAASFAQKSNKAISEKEVIRIEKILSSDEFAGRSFHKNGVNLAANFIANEFKESQLSFLTGNDSYFQEFKTVKVSNVSIVGQLNNEPLTTQNTIVQSSMELVSIQGVLGMKTIVVKKGDDFSKIIFQQLEGENSILFLIDTSHNKRINRLKRFVAGQKIPSSKLAIFIFSTQTIVDQFQITANNAVVEQNLKNIVAVLPGKSLANEIVLFSAHYDHLGIGKPNAAGDSIFNGANDDAAGVTAMLLLAKHFKNAPIQNERTIIFVAFDAEESGLIGSTYFASKVDADNVKAMFNIEMIGTQSKWGKNSAYITGNDKSDFAEILQTNLKKSKFNFYPDPYPAQNLFYRSDNASLAERGVPAHTISTSKMDEEKFYHTQEDEIETLDMKNMTEIIKAISLSSTSIISGKHTPSRVKKQ